MFYILFVLMQTRRKDKRKGAGREGEKEKNLEKYTQ